jgi:ssDNA thymidine ADP-ribosyltransferase, DarT
MSSTSAEANVECTPIFRIVHCSNIPWILDNGLHCFTSTCRDPDFVAIGNGHLIEKRATRQVPESPYGVLADYVPFYFARKTPMMLNIFTGHNGVVKRNRSEICILVTRLQVIMEMCIPFVFTDRHAYSSTAQFFRNIDDLDKVDWRLIQSGNFSRDSEKPDLIDKYQAEFLVFGSLQVAALRAIVVYDDDARKSIQYQVHLRGLTLKVMTQKGWYC